MDERKNELKNTALRNRKYLLKKTLIPDINNSKRYSLKVAGVGQKSIKLTTYVSYENILKYSNDVNSIEYELLGMINTIYKDIGVY